MRKIELYENFITNLFKKQIKIDDLVDHIRRFTLSETNNNVSNYKGVMDFEEAFIFYFSSKNLSILKKQLFYIIDFSKYAGDTNKIEDKNFDIILMQNFNDLDIPTEIHNISMFIYDTIRKYRTKYSTNYSKIEDIINDINSENYHLYVNTNKYNI